MAFQLDLRKYQSSYIPLAIFAGCLVVAAAIYGSGGIRIGGGGEPGESPDVAGEGEAQPEEGTQTEPKTSGEADLDNFSKCLTEKGATIYVHRECGHCKNQRDLFGASFQYLNRVECADESGGWSEVCPNAGVTGVPTWVFKDGSKAVGLQTLEALSEKTGCPLQ